MKILQITSISEDEAAINVEETTHLVPKVGGTKTAYTAKHQFVFKRNNIGRWKMVAAHQMEPSGLLPLGEAETYVAPNSDYFERDA
ncbi:MAG: hypothetical protein Q4P66_00665 [Actinomycetaceae bacterium]|nr:hypothetical protein [Actinomycetaceae bacterium]